VAGLAGGLVSSTAAVLSFSRLAKGQDNPRSLAAGAIAANTMMFARVGVVAGALRPQIALPIATAIVPAALAGAAAVGLLLWRSTKDREAAELPPPKNPLSLRSAFVFGALLTAISLAAAILNETVGAAGTLALAAIAGVADVDAITLSMTQSAQTAADTAVMAILIAISVNTVVKCGLAFTAGGPAMGRIVAIASAASLVAAAAGYAASLLVFASPA